MVCRMGFVLLPTCNKLPTAKRYLIERNQRALDMRSPIVPGRLLGVTRSSRRSTASLSQRWHSRSSSSSSKASNPETAKSSSKITWTRGYLGANSDTKPPDATFMVIASVICGAGFYAWFIEPPQQQE